MYDIDFAVYQKNKILPGINLTICTIHTGSIREFDKLLSTW